MTIDATGSEDAWQRQALIAIEDDSSSMDVMAITETIDIDMGERDLDKIDLMNLGQIPKHGAVGITTVTFECYPLYVGSASAGAAGGIWEFFAEKPLADASGVLQVDMTNTLTRYRVAICWTNDADATGADEEMDSSDLAIRFIMADCFCTSCKTTMTDGIMKQTMTFKGLAFDKAGAANIKMESCTTSETLPVLTSYTPSSAKW